MITLPHLLTALGAELRAAPGTTPSGRALSGVHVSELEDPTPYLEGGELLLTTGMPLASGADAVRAYVQRLAERGVNALGLGLGPWSTSAPATLSEACAGAGIDLVLVPDGVPFQSVSRAYWSLALRDDTAGLRELLGTQSALARAATRPDATAAVVRGLAQALGGWAAYVPTGGGAPTAWPDDVEPLLPALRDDLARFDRAGAPAAATFELHGHPVVAHPIAGAARTHGVLAIGSGRTLGGADRQLISTVCTLLALRARQRDLSADTTATLGGAVVRLVQAGQTEAARLLADELGLAPLPERVRWLVLRTGPGHDAAAALESVGRLRPLGHSPVPEDAMRRLDEDGLLALLLPAGAWPRREAAPFESPADDPVTGEPLGARTAPRPPSTDERPAWAGGALGEAVPLAAAATSLAEVRRVAAHAPSGTLSLPDAVGPGRAAGWVQALRDYRRADLLGTVTAYLRHRGRWEEAARELGAHRNSVRHRIGLAHEAIGADLDDPDVAAELWLALRDGRGA